MAPEGGGGARGSVVTSEPATGRGDGSATGAIGPDPSGTLPAARPVARRGLRWPAEWPLAAALAVTGAAWGVLFAQRVGSHQPNVDDYLYALTAYHLAHGGLLHAPFRALHTGTTAPLVPLLAALSFGADSVNGTAAVQVVFLLAAVAGAYCLARRWCGPRASAIVALAAGLNQAVLGYATEVNFSVAVCASVLWALACYLWSDHLRRPGWSLGFGASVAGLLLSRSLAPAYVAPLAVVVVGDLVAHWWRTHRWPRWPVGGALAVILVVAGPWWLVSGPTAFHYLTHAGYQASSGFTSGGASLSLASLHGRLTDTANDLGRVQREALWAALVAGLAVAVVRWRATVRSRAWVAVAWAVLTFVVLSTSSNIGTGFGTPVLAVAVVCSGVALAHLPRRVLAVPGVMALLLLATGQAAELTGVAHQAWLGAPYRVEVIQAGGNRATDVGAVTAEVADLVGTQPTVVVRNDDVMNTNGLRWMLRGRASRLAPVANGPSGTGQALAALPTSAFLVTGTTPAPYNGELDQAKVVVAAERDGYLAVDRIVVSPTNDIVVWERPRPGSPPVVSHLPAPTTDVAKPAAGARLAGVQYLVARAAAPGGVASVSFRVTGGGLARPLVEPARPFAYGYLGIWATSSVPNGTYTIRSVATGFSGKTAVGAPVAVTVAN